MITAQTIDFTNVAFREPITVSQCIYTGIFIIIPAISLALLIDSFIKKSKGIQIAPWEFTLMRLNILIIATATIIFDIQMVLHAFLHQDNVAHPWILYNTIMVMLDESIFFVCLISFCIACAIIMPKNNIGASKPVPPVTEPPGGKES